MQPMEEDEVKCHECKRGINLYDEPAYPMVMKPCGVSHTTVYLCKECADAT